MTVARKKITEPEHIEALDQLTDEDAFGLHSERKDSDFDESCREVQDVINLVFSTIAPKWLTIECNRHSIFITDRRRGVEFIYSKYAVTPTVAADSITRARDEFEVQKLVAKRRRKLSKPKVRRGDWYHYPELQYYRYNLDFADGGTVPCGLPSGEDCVPAIGNYGDENNQVNLNIGLGEFIWSRPAVAMLDPNFNLEKGTEVLSIIHDHYRLKAREKGYK